jgi:acyl-CoA hydrolase
MSERPSRRAPTVNMSDIVLPGQTNNHGTMFGGEVLAMMDKAAALASLRFCRQQVVTASTERIDFRTPIRRGDLIDMVARVIYAGTTSMIVRIDAWTERPLSGERHWCTTGYYSMVSVDDEGRPAPIPRLLVETEAEQADWEHGAKIKASIQARLKDAPPLPVDPQQGPL